MKKILLLVCMMGALFANTITNLSDLDALHFEDAFEKKVSIPKGTTKLLVSFDKKSNAFMSEFLKQQDKGFLPKNKAIYIGDIHNMPSIITMMFARPKMKKYDFTIFLYEEEDLDKYIPMQEDKVTIISLDEEGKVLDIAYSDKAEGIF